MQIKTTYTDGDNSENDSSSYYNNNICNMPLHCICSFSALILLFSALSLFAATANYVTSQHTT